MYKHNFSLQGIIQQLEQATDTIYMKSLSNQRHYNVNNTKFNLTTFLSEILHTFLMQK